MTLRHVGWSALSNQLWSSRSQQTTSNRRHNPARPGHLLLSSRLLCCRRRYRLFLFLPPRTVDGEGAVPVDLLLTASE